MVRIESDIESVIQRFIKVLQKERHIISVFLYGSHAKGRAGKWSDIDIAVVSSDFSEDLFHERVGLMTLSSRIDKRIEPRPFRPEDFDVNDPLVNEIFETGIEFSTGEYRG